MSVWQAFRQREVLQLLTVYFLAVNGYYGFTLWLPSILQKAGLPTLQVTLVTIIPFFAGLVAMLLVGWSSDKSGERRRIRLPILVAGLGMRLHCGGESHCSAFSLVSIGGPPIPKVGRCRQPSY
jgi:MFS family permease